MKNWFRFTFKDGTHIWVHTQCGWLGLLRYADTIPEDKYNGTVIMDVRGLTVLKCLFCKYILRKNYVEVKK